MSSRSHLSSLSLKMRLWYSRQIDISVAIDHRPSVTAFYLPSTYIPSLASAMGFGWPERSIMIRWRSFSFSSC